LLKRTYEGKNGEWQQVIENSGMELREFAALSLEKVNVKSKKKRIRLKALKKALTQKEVVKDILVMVQKEKQDVKPSKEEERESELSVQGLPVTTLLKLGKKYVKEANAVKYYYNADKQEFYKNKNKLETVIDKGSKSLESSEYASFQKELKVELDKRQKK
jgi:hypothetical protein